MQASLETRGQSRRPSGGIQEGSGSLFLQIQGMQVKCSGAFSVKQHLISQENMNVAQEAAFN